MTDKNNDLKKGMFFIMMTTIAFSTMEITGKMISGSIDPFQLTLIRFLIGTLFLMPFAVVELRQRGLKLGRSDFLFFLFNGFIGVVISMGFFQFAVLMTKASVVAVIFSTNPIFTAPLAALILKEKLTRAKVAAIMVSVLGVLLIFNPFSGTADIKGMLMALIAAVCFSLYTVIGKTKIQKYGGIILTSFSFLMGVLMLYVIILVMGRPVLAGIGAHNILQLLYLGIFVTGVGYFCYFSAMKHTTAIMTSTVFFIKPALASVLSFVILREHLTWNTIAGIALIIVSSILMVRGRLFNRPEKTAIK